MDNRKEILKEILKLVQKNYTGAIEIQRITKELADTLQRNDGSSSEILLDMRGRELEKVRENRYDIQALLSVLDQESAEQVRNLLNDTSKETGEDFESRKILEMSQKIRRVLEQTITVDQVLNRKLAGADSYYQLKSK